MLTTDEIGETLGDIRSQLLVVRDLLSKVDDMYGSIRDDMIKGNVDKGTWNSDQHTQIARMHVSDATMLIQFELSGLEVIDGGDVND